VERVTEYFDQLLQQTKESGWVLNEELTFREIDDKEGYIRGTLHIYGGFTLHVAEYIDIKEGYPKRYKYRYQLQDRADTLLARWDNAPHHQEIHTNPFHKHCKDGEIVPSPEMNIPRVLGELDDVLKDVM